MITHSDIIYFLVTDRFKNSQIPDAQSNGFHNLKRYYGGNFEGIKQKIDYLIDLGITALWITPVYLNVGRVGDSDSYHGYWTMDFDLIDPKLLPENQNNTKSALKNLVDILHQNGIKVILDMVVNHTGYHNNTYIQYHEQLRQNNPEERRLTEEWFNKDGEGEFKGELSGLPDLNHDNPDVRDYFVNNITDWIEDTGIDAIRMDTVKHVEDAFWHAFKSYIKGRFPEKTLIGEVLNPDAANISRYQTLMDFDSLFDFPLQQTIVSTFVHEGPLTWLARPRLNNLETKGVLDVDTQFYANANRLVTLLDNHDLGIGRIKTAILNHTGHWDRQLAMKIQKTCLSFLLTTRGIPQLYYGTEIGLEGEKDPENRNVFRWDLLDPQLQHQEAIEAREIFTHTKALIQIRKSNKCLQYGYLFTLYVDQYIYAYMREYRNEVIVVIINNGRGNMQVPLTIQISTNINIPFRIRSLCTQGNLKNMLAPNETLPLSETGFEIMLSGKETKILKLHA